jgi:hypothetical protein
MLGAAGVLGQEIAHPDQFWYMQVRAAAATRLATTARLARSAVRTVQQ